MSHFKIWEKLITNSKYDKLYIFEDDTVPTFSKETLDKYLTTLPNDWDICLLGGVYKSELVKIDKFYCTHGYVINNKRIQFLLENAYPISKQIDSWLSDLAKENKINIYGITTNKWVQTNYDTDIQIPILGFGLLDI